MEIPIDLSEVLFIATANNVQTIPGPLLDRMELIEVTSYTENEKVHIAREHLLPKQMEANGITEQQLTVSDKALERDHQRLHEGGGRPFSLERKHRPDLPENSAEDTGKRREKGLCNRPQSGKISGQGSAIMSTNANPEPRGGNCHEAWPGPVWAAIPCRSRSTSCPGRVNFRLTGQLGDVMKESAQAGISYIRSVSKAYGIEEEFFKKHDIHIHIPEGAVPKDGPSAGITMATAMLSAITQDAGARRRGYDR